MDKSTLVENAGRGGPVQVKREGLDAIVPALFFKGRKAIVTTSPTPHEGTLIRKFHRREAG